MNTATFLGLIFNSGLLGTDLLETEDYEVEAGFEAKEDALEHRALFVLRLEGMRKEVFVSYGKYPEMGTEEWQISVLIRRAGENGYKYIGTGSTLELAISNLVANLF